MLNRIPVGCGETHRKLLANLSKFALTDAEILLNGDSGVGKEVYAQFLHKKSYRHKFPFVPVNCSTLENGLLENELFGHVGGAFTGAKPNNIGLIEAADRGTLFLDEVDSLSLSSQVKLLRFIQEKEFRKLGDSHLRKANVRIISATNTDLVDAVNKNIFRKDLFFRLRVIPIEIPRLSERNEDVPLLIEKFSKHYSKLYNLPVIRFESETLEVLMTYSWPGNIRELENCIHYLTCIQSDQPIKPQDLQLLNSEKLQKNKLTRAPQSIKGSSLGEEKRQLVAQFERKYIEEKLRENNGNITLAASESGKPRRAFDALCTKHGIKAEDYKNKSKVSDD